MVAKKGASGKRAPKQAARVAAKPAGARAIVRRAAMEDARSAGLLEGEKTEHFSFRAPKALVDAAMRESGATTRTELGLLALAMVAQRDPFADFLKETRGTLAADHDLDY